MYKKSIKSHSTSPKTSKDLHVNQQSNPNFQLMKKGKIQANDRFSRNKSRFNTKNK